VSAKSVVREERVVSVLDVVVRDTTSVECFLVVFELLCWVVVYMNRLCMSQL
jgi:hypothetical protein